MRSVNAMSSEKICGKSRTCVVELNRGGNEALRRVSPPPSRLCFLSIWRFSFETSKPQKIKTLGGTNTYIAKWRDVLGCMYNSIHSFLKCFWSFDVLIFRPRDCPRPKRFPTSSTAEGGMYYNPIYLDSRQCTTVLSSSEKTRPDHNSQSANFQKWHYGLHYQKTWKTNLVLFTDSCLSGIDSLHNVISSRLACS